MSLSTQFPHWFLGAADLVTALSDDPNAYPFTFDGRAEIATGQNGEGITIGGFYTQVKSCSVYPRQEFEQIALIQGGPRLGISKAGKKYVEGEIVMYLRVDRDGNLDPAVRVLLENAQEPLSTIQIDTNHAVAYPDITLDCPDDAFSASEGNELLSFNTLIVTELTLKAQTGQAVELTAKVQGTFEGREASQWISRPTDFLLGRAMSFGDCDAGREESDMRLVQNFSIKVVNKLDMGVYLVSKADGVDSVRTDQPTSLTVTECQWTGELVETLRKGLETNSAIRGGWEIGSSLTADFGAVIALIPVPLFEISDQDLSASFLQRTTRFFATNNPTLKSGFNPLFSFPAY